jgi:Tol biopolymer transport system component
LLDLKTRASRQLPGSDGVCFPRWAPNGRYLVANSLPNVTKLRLFDFKTNVWRDLVSNVGTISYFSWSSDSKHVYFDNLLTDHPSYLRVRISDSKLEQVTSLKSLRRYISDFEVPYSGLTPGEIPIFARDTSVQEIYALDWRN